MTVTDTSIEERLAALDALIREHALAGERDRSVAASVIDALRAAGAFDLCVPRALGGLEADPTTVVRAIERVSEADAASGWTVMIGAGTGIISGFLEPEVCREIYGRRGVFTAGVVAPRGRADIAGDDYRVNGRWPFASGCHHADWLVGGSLIFDAGQMRLLANGAPDWRLMLFPRGGVEVIDTWEVAGLRATGSHDIAARDVVVPRPYSVSFQSDPLVHDGPLYRFPTLALLGVTVAGVALGAARRAITEMRELALTKSSLGANKPLFEQAMAQERVARAEATLRSGRAFLFDAIGEAWQLLLAGDPVIGEQRALLRLAATHAVATSVQAVDAMFELGGSASIYTAHPLQRLLRDVHVMTQHAMVGQMNYEQAGRVFFGLHPTLPTF